MKPENIYSKIYGLTGVIGSGKTTAAGMFKKLGAVVIDADELARKVMSEAYPDYPKIRDQIIHIFGKDSIIANQTINRPFLAQIVFQDKLKLGALNSIIHPHVQKLFFEKYRQLGLEKKVIIYDVPLLFETKLEKKLKKVILIYATEKICAQRAAIRMNLPEMEILQRMKNQISMETKMKNADYIIDNTGTFDSLALQIKLLYDKLFDIENE